MELRHAFPIPALAVLILMPLWGRPNLLDLARACESKNNGKACRELVKIAEKNKDLDLRSQAIKLLWDETVLSRIAAQATILRMRQQALDRLQTIYAKNALAKAPMAARMASLEKLTDRQRLLTIVGSESKDGAEIRLAALGKVADPGDLVSVVLKAADPAVRKAALGRIAEERRLMRIVTQLAANPPGSEVLDAAFEKLRDPRSFAALVTSCPSEDVVRRAARKIDNAELLAALAEKAAKPDVQTILVERIADRQMLMTVAAASPVESAALLAAGRLSGQGEMAELAGKSRHEKVRRAAVERLVDPRFLIEIAGSGKDEGLSRLALGRLFDEAHLASVALTAAFTSVRVAAVSRIETPERLLEIICRTDSEETGGKAVSQLADQKSIAEAVRGAALLPVRLAAAGRLTDRTLILEFAAKDPEWQIRKTAAGLLSGNPALLKFIAAERNQEVRKAAAARLVSPKRLTELLLWLRAEGQDSEQGFDDYLAVYPKGRHAAEARQRREAAGLLEGELVYSFDGTSGPAPAIFAKGRTYKIRLSEKIRSQIGWDSDRTRPIPPGVYRVRGKILGDEIAPAEFSLLKAGTSIGCERQDKDLTGNEKCALDRMQELFAGGQRVAGLARLSEWLAADKGRSRRAAGTIGRLLRSVVGQELTVDLAQSGQIDAVLELKKHLADDPEDLRMARQVGISVLQGMGRAVIEKRRSELKPEELAELAARVRDVAEREAYAVGAVVPALLGGSITDACDRLALWEFQDQLWSGGPYLQNGLETSAVIAGQLRAAAVAELDPTVKATAAAVFRNMAVRRGPGSENPVQSLWFPLPGIRQMEGKWTDSSYEFQPPGADCRAFTYRVRATVSGVKNAMEQQQGPQFFLYPQGFTHRLSGRVCLPLDDSGVVIHQEVGGGLIGAKWSNMDSPMPTLSVDRIEFSGTVSARVPSSTLVLEIEADPAQPLVFQVRSSGYHYVSGRGSLKLPGGQTLKLGQ